MTRGFCSASICNVEYYKPSQILSYSWTQPWISAATLKQLQSHPIITLRIYQGLKDLGFSRIWENFVHASVFNKLNYCNVVFTGLSRKNIRELQPIENAAASVLTKTKKDYIPPALRPFFCLPVKEYFSKYCCWFIKHWMVYTEIYFWSAATLWTIHASEVLRYRSGSSFYLQN